MSLNPRQQRFVEEYAKDCNAAQAAIRAGYSGKTARSIGARLLTNVNVVDAVEKARREVTKQAQVDAVWLLRRLVTLADVKIADLFDAEGKLRDPEDMPDGAQYLIAGIEVEDLFERDQDGNRERVGTLRKVKLESRMKALEMIGKHVDVGAFLERLLVSEEGSLATDILEARKRARELRGKAR